MLNLLFDFFFVSAGATIGVLIMALIQIGRKEDEFYEKKERGDKK